MVLQFLLLNIFCPTCLNFSFLIMNDLLNKITETDCLEYLKQIPDNTIDLVIIDPPYCVGTTSNGHKGSYSDNNLIRPFFEIVFKEFSRVLKDGSEFYINTDWRTYSFLYPILARHLTIKNLIVWDYQWMKAGNAYRFTHELIMYGVKGGYTRKFSASESDVWRIKCVNFTQDRLHNAQKPTELITKMILNSSKENDIILDCFMGSGTTTYTAKNLKRNFLGCEIDPTFCELANKRVNEELNNTLNLF
jgi:site-specific DNA-methyltransferase (adenine-specific)